MDLNVPFNKALRYYRSVLALQNIHFSYGSTVALWGIDLNVEKGEILAVTGPAGSGKTTLLKIMAGLLRPDQGKVTRAPGEWGMTFQYGGLLDQLSCAENLRFPLRERKCVGDLEQKVEKALADVGLAQAKNLSVSQLSGGMQKRLGLARALVLRPEILFLDEPTAGLDPVTATSIWDLIFRESVTRTLVIGLSDPVKLLKKANRLAFLVQGKMEALGEPLELRKSTDVSLRAFLRVQA